MNFSNNKLYNNNYHSTTIICMPFVTLTQTHWGLGRLCGAIGSQSQAQSRTAYMKPWANYAQQCKSRTRVSSASKRARRNCNKPITYMEMCIWLVCVLSHVNWIWGLCVWYLIIIYAWLLLRFGRINNWFMQWNQFSDNIARIAFCVKGLVCVWCALFLVANGCFCV